MKTYGKTVITAPENLLSTRCLPMPLTILSPENKKTQLFSPSPCSGCLASLFLLSPLKLLLFSFQRENPEKRPNSPFLFFLFLLPLSPAAVPFLYKPFSPSFFPSVFPSNLAIKRPAPRPMAALFFFCQPQLILGFSSRERESQKAKEKRHKIIN